MWNFGSYGVDKTIKRIDKILKHPPKTMDKKTLGNIKDMRHTLAKEVRKELGYVAYPGY